MCLLARGPAPVNTGMEHGAPESPSSKSHHPSQYGGCHMMRDLPRYARLIERGLFDAKSMITSTWRLEQTREAYQAVADRTTVAAVIVFS
jgi:Zn-dependent alcohol dehydrogenase